MEQQKNGRNKRAGMADADPPDEIDDGKSPRDGNVDAPDADALVEQPRYATKNIINSRKAIVNPTSQLRGCCFVKNYRADGFGDRLVGLARRQQATRDNPAATAETACRQSVRLNSGYGVHACESRIRIAQFGQIGGARPRVQFAQHAVIERMRFEFRDAAVADRSMSPNTMASRGTSLLAGGADFAVADAAGPRSSRRDAGGADALDAVGAFFHDAAPAHGDFGLRISLRLGV